MYMKYGKIKFGYKDTYSLDYTLSTIIYAGLLKFKEVITSEECAGVPGEIMSDLFPDYKGYDYTEDELEQGRGHWIEIIDKMVYAFYPKEHVNREEYKYKLSELKTEPIEGTSLRKMTDDSLKPSNEAEYDRYHKDKEMENMKRKEGRELFAKYFENLWW